jgi:Smg protein
MFDILVYLYETYYRPDTCPDSIALAKKLSSVGFDDEEIVVALDWLRGLADTTNELASIDKVEHLSAAELSDSVGFRVFTEEESAMLGSESIGYLYYLQNTKMLNAQQREIVIERAMAVHDQSLSLSKFKIIVLMILWSQGLESEMLMFDEFLLSDDEQSHPLLH